MGAADPREIRVIAEQAMGSNGILDSSFGIPDWERVARRGEQSGRGANRGHVRAQRTWGHPVKGHVRGLGDTSVGYRIGKVWLGRRLGTVSPVGLIAC